MSSEIGCEGETGEMRRRSAQSGGRSRASEWERCNSTIGVQSRVRSLIRLALYLSRLGFRTTTTENSYIDATNSGNGNTTAQRTMY